MIINNLYSFTRSYIINKYKNTIKKIFNLLKYNLEFMELNSYTKEKIEININKWLTIKI